MRRLKDLSKKVKAILEKDKAARNSDSILLLHLLREMGTERGLDIDKMSVPMYLIYGRDLQLPTLESVGRVRRKIVEANPELAGVEDVEAVKMQLEETYRQFAKEVHYV